MPWTGSQQATPCVYHLPAVLKLGAMMNLLKTYTLTTERPDTFLVYWTNSIIRPKGVLRVQVLPQIVIGT
jgi:hypothetical protein